ncbi:MAG: alpha-L-fucosidase [Ruminococcaceae bacterium]|nr:alpha-L-fucosidase [Oscillospiraceae bacterium]
MAIPVAKKYIADFENMGFGMFVHWGLYSQVGQGEWHFHHSDITMDEYKKLFDTFTAEDFDAEEMVLMAKSAGCKYITLTTRHHEGFSLFDTCGLSDFDAPHSPAKRDLVREFVDACNKHDIVPFFYHTTLDWYQESFETDFDAYLEYLRKSVEILCKNYGKIGGLWFDGNWSKPDADWKEDELYATIRKWQPEAMIINNTGLAELGRLGHPEIDSVTFEQGRPTPMKRAGMPKYLAAEMCYTINDHWGIGDMDFNYKSPAELIRTLCACRKVGANLLLNIGPTAQGGIDPFQKALFGIIGKWVKVFGEAIYEVKPYPAYCTSPNFALKANDGSALYLFFTDLSRGGSAHVVAGTTKYAGAYSFGDVTDEIESVHWIDNGEELSFLQGDGMLTFNAKGYDYGLSTCVRVAKAIIKK